MSSLIGEVCEFCGEKMTREDERTDGFGEFHAESGAAAVTMYGNPHGVLITTAVGHASCGVGREGWSMA